METFSIELCVNDSLYIEIAIGKSIIDYHQNGDITQLNDDMYNIIKKKIPNNEYKASIYYELWKINKSKESQTSAIELYQILYDDTPKYIFKSRLEELES